VSVARFVADQRTFYGVPYAVCCAILGMSVSWLYKWLDRPATARQRRRAELHEHLVDRIGEIAGRIDERAVEIEGDQAAVYVAHDVGVSHTVTRTTGRPCSREMSKISLAIRSTVGLLSMT